ncbi:guanylate-binding protein [Paraphysoderma sedebokerense]|nr:guanylate-binding protein [Paraphysoderma sedebokerense]
MAVFDQGVSQIDQLAGKNNGFDIGSSIEPQTQGIWMWPLSQSQLQEAGFPSDISIILLDTEGLGSFTKTESHDVKIFALAVLLSSYMIYNSLGTIDDNAMDNISLIVELTKKIKASAEQDDKQDPYALRTFFPKFMWLLRDFSLDLVMDGKKVSPPEYLENALKQLPGDGPEVESKNKIRECIRTFFDDRTCYTLKRPVEDEEQLQSLGSLKMSDFRPEYLAEVRNLIEYIYKKVTPKTLYGCCLNGSMFNQLARNYVEAINSGSVPVIKNAWENVVRIQCQYAVDSALKTYKRTMSERFESTPIVEYSDLLVLHQAAEDSSLDDFFKKMVVNGVTNNDVKGYLMEVRTATRKVLEKFENENSEHSKEYCQSLWGKLVAELGNIMKDTKIASFDALLNSYRDILKKYDSQAQGPGKYSEFFKAADGHVFEYVRMIADVNVQEAEAKVKEKFELEKEKQRHEYTVLQELYKSVDSEWQKQEEASKRLRAENTDMKYELMGLQKSVKSLTSENDELKSTVGALQKEKVELETKAKEKEDEAKKTKVELEDVTRLRNKDMEEANAALEALRKQKQEAEEKMEQAKGQETEIASTINVVTNLVDRFETATSTLDVGMKTREEEIQQWKNKFEKLEKESEDKNRGVEELKTGQKDFQEKYDQLQQQVERLLSENSTLKSTVATLEKDISILQSKSDTSISATEKNKSLYEEAQKKVTEKENEAKEKAQQYNSLLERYNTAMKEADIALEGMRRQKQEVEEELNALKGNKCCVVM